MLTLCGWIAVVNLQQEKWKARVWVHCFSVNDARLQQSWGPYEYPPHMVWIHAIAAGPDSNLDDFGNEESLHHLATILRKRIRATIADHFDSQSHGVLDFADDCWEPILEFLNQCWSSVTGTFFVEEFDTELQSSGGSFGPVSRSPVLPSRSERLQNALNVIIDTLDKK
jgi:hypothetical protein